MDSSQQVTYVVDGDSTDYTNSGQAVVLLLDDSLLHSDSIRVSYSGTTLADSASPRVSTNFLAFSQVDAINLSSVSRIEDLTSTKSSISEDLGYDGTPTTAQIVSLADEDDSTNYLILDQEILSSYYDVDGAADGSNLALYNVVADHGYFTRNDANTGWFYRPEVNFSGQVIVSFDVFDGSSFTPGSASLDVQSINDIPVRIAGNVSGIIIPEGASTDTIAPTLEYASLNGNTLVLNFSESLDSSVVIADDTFAVKVADSAVSYTVGSPSYSKSNTAITLILDGPAPSSDASVSIDYASDIVQDTAFVENKLVEFTDFTVANSTSQIPP